MHASSQVNLQSFDSCFVIIDSHVVNGLPFVSFLWHMLVPFFTGVFAGSLIT